MAARTPRSKIAPEGGSYRIVLKSGALAGVVAANSPLFSLRWTSSTKRLLLWAVKWQFVTETAAGAAQTFDSAMYVARSFTASDTGGTAATLTGDNLKLDVKFPSTAVATGDIRICDTGMLTAGTRTLDTQPMVYDSIWMSNALIIGAGTGNSSVFGYADSLNPITIRQDEGLVINNLTAIGGTTVVRFYAELEWSEVDNGVA